MAGIRRLTAHDIPTLQGRVPTEAIEGNTPDISEYAQFDWYQGVWYIDPAVQFQENWVDGLALLTMSGVR